jgi:hypothetical protein
MRLALTACARTLAGKPAAGATKRRKRSVSYNALGYAVEQGHLMRCLDDLMRRAGT